MDITAQVNAVVDRSGVRNGLMGVYAQGAIAAISLETEVSCYLFLNLKWSGIKRARYQD